MPATETTPRSFRLPLRSVTMSERRLMVKKFDVNWDAVEVDLADIPQPADREAPTDEERLAIAKVFTRAVGPIEKFALLFVAVKRELPHATETEIETHADTGEWVLDLSADSEAEDAGSPLPAPTTEPT